MFDYKHAIISWYIIFFSPRRCVPIQNSSASSPCYLVLSPHTRRMCCSWCLMICVPSWTAIRGKISRLLCPPIMHTPNLDKLASTSLLLNRAYAQQGLCNPSRTSLLTSRRPDTTHVYDLHHYFRTFSGNFTTPSQYFKEQGYRTIGAGKVFHPGMESGHNDPISWTDPYYMPYESMDHWETFNYSWRTVSPTERKQIPLPDDLFTEFAIENLKELVSTPGSETQPSFLAIGFLRPHPPITYAEEYSNHYPLDDIRLAPNPFVPVGSMVGYELFAAFCWYPGCKYNRCVQCHFSWGSSYWLTACIL